MKYLLTLLMICFSVNYIDAQKTQISFERNSDIKIYRNHKDNFKGSPFYNEDWVIGNVIFKDGSKSNDINLKYSSYFNQLFFQKDDQLLVVSPNTFNGFILKMKDGNALFKKAYRSDENEITTELLLEVIYNGKVDLLTHHRKKIIEQKTDPLKGEITKTFISTATSYLVDAEGNFHEVELDKDDILGALQKHEKELGQYAEDNDLEFDNKRDLSKILEYYDSLSRVSE